MDAGRMMEALLESQFALSFLQLKFPTSPNRGPSSSARSNKTAQAMVRSIRLDSRDSLAKNIRDSLRKSQEYNVVVAFEFYLR